MERHLFLLLLFAAIWNAVNAVCTDDDDRCGGWAKSGECLSNPGYMHQSCKKSCNKCAEEVCKDIEKENLCIEWKDAGYCKATSVFYTYMKRECQKACGFCKVEASVVDDCKDTYNTTDCAEWAKDGECEANPDWMNVNCKKSCKICSSTSVVDDCKDSYGTTDCAEWAKDGECETNPDWMNVNCKKSCKICSSGSTKTESVAAFNVSEGTGSKDTKKDKDVTEVNDKYCGLRLKARVVGGTDAAVGDWPWQVGIARWYNPSTPFCGGSLINKQWVVTANHCFGTAGKAAVPKDFVVLLGEHDISKKDGSEKVVKASKIIRHEDYKLGSYDADIALVKLESPVTYNAFIKPVCLPEKDQDEIIGDSCYVTGWGRTKEGGQQSKVLQEAKLPIVSRKTCSDAFGFLSQVTENMICAGFKKGGIDACQGDSGGPFVCKKKGRFQLAGVVSFGRGCARANLYGVYAKVSKYVNWIKRKIKE